MIYLIFSVLLLNTFIYVYSLKVSDYVHCRLSPNWDQCDDNAFNSSRKSPFRMEISKQRKEYQYFCACDSDCHHFNDCCASVEHSKGDMISVPKLSCINVTGSSLAIYAIDSCPDSFADSKIAEKCTENLLNSSHLHDHLLVYSVSSKVMYKNIFCAICNGDMQNLTTFPVDVSCKNFPQERELNNTWSDKLWVYENEMWTYDNTSNQCSIEQNGHLSAIMNGEINARPCLKSIDTCHHTWKDLQGEVAQMCRNYTSHVVSIDSSKAYKNMHCALCNHNNEVFCLFWDMKSDERFEKFSFKTLLDIRFDECKSDTQIFDKELNTCVNYKIANKIANVAQINRIGTRTFSFVSNDSFSVPKKTKVCKTLVFSPNSYIEVNKSTVYINVTDTFYSETEFFLNDEDKSVEICIEEFHTLPHLNEKIQAILSYICLSTSIICLTLQLLVYSLIPKLQTQPGKILMSLSFSLLIANISFISMQLIDANKKNVICIIDALSTHYFFLCSFFWMNVMSFDIYTVFGRFEGKKVDSNFLKYSLYAWLCPAVIVLIAINIEYLLDNNKYQPMYGVHNCWIGQRSALLIFFIIPLTIIVIINFALFALTTKELIATKKLTKSIAKKEETIRFKLYVKIAILMGLTWIFGIAATFSGSLFLWYPFIVLNGSQGVFIFFAFGFKREHFNYLKQIIKKEKSMATIETGTTER